jgi:hypothetical protein
MVNFADGDLRRRHNRLTQIQHRPAQSIANEQLWMSRFQKLKNIMQTIQQSRVSKAAVGMRDGYEVGINKFLQLESKVTHAIPIAMIPFISVFLLILGVPERWHRGDNGDRYQDLLPATQRIRYALQLAVEATPRQTPPGFSFENQEDVGSYMISMLFGMAPAFVAMLLLVKSASIEHDDLPIQHRLMRVMLATVIAISPPAARLLFSAGVVLNKLTGPSNLFAHILTNPEEMDRELLLRGYALPEPVVDQLVLRDPDLNGQFGFQRHIQQRAYLGEAVSQASKIRRNILNKITRSTPTKPLPKIIEEINKIAQALGLTEKQQQTLQNVLTNAEEGYYSREVSRDLALVFNHIDHHYTEKSLEEMQRNFVYYLAAVEGCATGRNNQILLSLVGIDAVAPLPPEGTIDKIPRHHLKFRNPLRDNILGNMATAANSAQRSELLAIDYSEAQLKDYLQPIFVQSRSDAQASKYDNISQQVFDDIFPELVQHLAV